MERTGRLNMRTRWFGAIILGLLALSSLLRAQDTHLVAYAV
jgi:hypothetical protein